jgi:hypothetical protein
MKTRELFYSLIIVGIFVFLQLFLACLGDLQRLQILSEVGESTIVVLLFTQLAHE